jgi:hypothetical protein
MNAPDQTVPEEAMLSQLSGASAELIANPFPLFAHMRSMGAVLPIPFPLAGTDRRARAVTRMEEAVQILKDHAHFTVDSGSIGVNDLFGQNNARTGFFRRPCAGYLGHLFVQTALERRRRYQTGSF